MRLAPTALAALLAEIGRAAVGGVIQVYAGGVPGEIGAVPQTATLLVELRVSAYALVPDGVRLSFDDGRAVSGSESPRWFLIRQPGGRVLADGEIGSGSGLLEIKPRTIVKDGLVRAESFVMGWGD